MDKFSSDPLIAVPKSTLSSLIKSSKMMKYKNRNPQPRMTKMHHQNHLDLAKDHMSWKLKCERAIFSSEIKFSLDGLDGFSYYWHDLRQKSKIRNVFNTEEGWFGFHSKINIAFSSCRMIALTYILYYYLFSEKLADLFGWLNKTMHTLTW